MRNKRKTLIFAITLLVLCFGIGYAYLNSTLNINGATQIDRTAWNVHFENVQMLEGSVSGTEPTIGADTTSLSFSTRLQKPGDYYAFSVDVKNDGTIDAMVSEVISKMNNVVITTIPDYLEYMAAYADEIPIEENHILEANTKEKLFIRVAYKHNLNALDLPSTAQNLNMSFDINYVQATDDAIERNSYVYFISGTTPKLGETVPSEDNLTRCLNSYDPSVVNNGVFIRMLVNSEKVVERAFIGYYINDSLYYLEGGVADEDIVRDNMNFIYTYSWSSSCTGCVGCPWIACAIGAVEDDGYIYLYNGSSVCSITSSGYIYCYD